MTPFIVAMKEGRYGLWSLRADDDEKKARAYVQRILVVLRAPRCLRIAEKLLVRLAAQGYTSLDWATRWRQLRWSRYSKQRTYTKYRAHQKSNLQSLGQLINGF